MDNALRVLQVEDSEDDAVLILRILQKAGYHVCSQRVEDDDAMRLALQLESWDVIVSDYHMPRFDAPAALAILQESGLDIPFIVVSGVIGEEMAVAMMKSGAHDYVMKGNLARLAPAVEREIRDARGREERRQAQETLRKSEELLRDFAERKRAEDSLRQLSMQLLRAQDEERRHIARELHDSIGQELAALGLNLGWIEQFAGNLDRRTQEVLSESLKLVNRCSLEIRDFSYLLHPPMLDEYGLASAVRWYVEGFGRRTGIQMALEIPDDLPRLPRNIETALFRVVQECLTNVHRHSGSPTASVRIVQESNCLCLEVTDQGRGADFSASHDDASRPGMGVAGMRERLRELGGSLEIEAGARGTTVRATLSLQEKAA